MELKHKLSPRIIFVSLYFLCFAAYIIYGLQPAEAAHYEIASQLAIPSISLETGVTKVEVNNGKLDTPDTIAGSYTRTENKTLLIGHSTTVFQDLNHVNLGDEITYDGKVYKVVKLEFKEKSRVDMTEILKREEKDTIVIMTCAGELLDGGDATHRFMVTAVAL